MILQHQIKNCIDSQPESKQKAKPKPPRGSAELGDKDPNVFAHYCKHDVEHAIERYRGRVIGGVLINEKIVRRVEAAGCPVIALTCDNTTGRNSQTFLRDRPKDLKQCFSCHEGGAGPSAKERKMYDGIDLTGVNTQYQAMTWEFVAQLRKATKLKLFIKGLDGREDARLAVEHGVDGILVSNHGGRSTDTLRPTIEALPEVVDAVRGRIPVFVDGGVRRGTDAFKALALGATAVGIGRPMLWGMGAFGQAGIDRVLEILQGELKLAMGNCGTRIVADIDRSYVELPDWRTVRYS